MRNFIIFKRVCQFVFLLLFIVYSHKSVKDFVDGKAVLVQLIQEKDGELKFPDVTLCPRQERSLTFLKTKKLQEDFNLSSSDIVSAKIFRFLGRNSKSRSSILENYSFTREESIIENMFL